MTGYGAVSQSVHCSGSHLGLPEPHGTAGPLQGGEREAACHLDAPALRFVHSIERVDLKCVFFSSTED